MEGLSCLAGRLTYPSHEGSLEGNGSAPLEGRFSYPLTLGGGRLGGKAGAGVHAPVEIERVSSRALNHVQCPVFFNGFVTLINNSSSLNKGNRDIHTSQNA